MKFGRVFPSRNLVRYAPYEILQSWSNLKFGRVGPNPNSIPPLAKGRDNPNLVNGRDGWARAEGRGS